MSFLQRTMLVCAFLAGICSAAGAQPVDLASSRAVVGQSALRVGENAVLAVVVDIKPGYHAQSATPSDENFIAFELAMEPNDQLIIGKPIYPKGHDRTYPALGALNLYDGRVVVYVPVQVKPDASPTGELSIRGTLTYQICDDRSCFAPESPEVAWQTKIVAATDSVEPVEQAIFKDFDPSVFAAIADATSGTAKPPAPAAKAQSLFGLELRDNAYLLAFAGAFVVGIIFNLVPCVLPVLPLKAVGFYEVAQHDRAKCFMFGLIFSAGIIATFAALAVPVLVFKAISWGELFGNVWFAGAVTVILIGMAAGMFGVFGVNMPYWVYNVTPRHDTVSGNFLFGILTAVLSTPCTFGLFFALLTWAALQPAVVGVLLLMVVGAGMASPYVLLSAFPGVAQKLPRAGAWSEIIKQMMGFLLLATAAYFGKMFLPDALRGPNFWWVIFALIAAAGVFLVVRAAQVAKHKLAIVAATVVAAGLIGPALAITVKLANPPIDWTAYSEEALAKARATGEPVLVKFTADWCANCQTIELTVFASEENVRWLRANRVTTIKADLTHQSAIGWPLLRQLNAVGAIPVTAVWRAGESEPQILAGIYSFKELRAAVGE
ncbi:MAG TPA: cytochrome c biogenesis protein CcdA [Tepidisphaeraceae bacterium]|nr:cytochrome c biogenesis protein CcdA [Tepidisphaeraceae bacterium]